MPFTQADIHTDKILVWIVFEYCSIAEDYDEYNADADDDADYKADDDQEQGEQNEDRENRWVFDCCKLVSLRHVDFGCCTPEAESFKLKWLALPISLHNALPHALTKQYSIQYIYLQLQWASTQLVNFHGNLWSCLGSIQLQTTNFDCRETSREEGEVGNGDEEERGDGEEESDGDSYESPMERFRKAMQMARMITRPGVSLEFQRYR